MAIYNDDDAHNLSLAWDQSDLISGQCSRQKTTTQLGQAITQDFKGRIVLLSSFGAEAAVLLHLVASIDANLPVLFLDTGKLFSETLTYRDQLVSRLGLTDVLSIQPGTDDIIAEDNNQMLWQINADRCCYLRKVKPLETALSGFDVVITGRKQYHGGTRQQLPLFEAQNGRLKFNPLTCWLQTEVENYIDEFNLPHHPLQKDGFLSIGCMTCTKRVAHDSDIRSGRWQELDKTECGIHLSSPSTARSENVNTPQI